MDILSPEKRSWVMSRVGSSNTKPELYVRSMLHRMGFRFRIGGKLLPGHPDIVLKKYMTCVFVHGCFWHQHKGCPKSRVPKSNVQFWQAKFERNIFRDEHNENALKSLGWNVVVVWECEIKDPEKLAMKLKQIKKGNGRRHEQQKA